MGCHQASFLQEFCKMKKMLHPECTGVINPVQAAGAVSDPVWGPPLYPGAAAEMSLWLGQELALA